MNTVNRNSDLENSFYQRRKKILKQIKGEAALFVGAQTHCQSRDLDYPYHQNTDFLYLTGFSEPESALLLLGGTRGPRSILFLRDRDVIAERWNGERLGLKRAKKCFNVDEVRAFSSLTTDLKELLSGTHTLHYASGTHPAIDTVVWDLLKTNVGPRLLYPNTLKDSRLITSDLRFVKDKNELRTIQHAIDITAHAFRILAPRLNEISSETHGARVLESHFAKLGAEHLAFPTIVASGRNATVLHHRPKLQPLWKRELVLIDAGASFHGYAADITRTLPASGKYTSAQAAVYDVVHTAQKEAIAKCAPGNSLDDVHMAAVRAITKGLIELGVLNGNVAQHVAAEDYKKFYMHRTGHWLGLDVHDISPVQFENHLVPAYSRPLIQGNVFTVEPGLYFDPKDKTIPQEYRGIGIRIEDDIVITATGCEVMSAKMPTERTEIEALMA